MRPGDVVTHCFHGNEGGLLDEHGKVWPEAFAARERGVLFDVGHGVGSFTWRVARAALEQGFPPDTISSDIHAYNHAGPVHDLPRTLSKLLHLGMPLPEVIAAATARVGEHLAHVAPAGLGTLAPGAPGDLSLLERQHGTLRARRRRAPALGGCHRVRRRSAWWRAASCARAPSSRATSRRDGAAHRRRPRRRRAPACWTAPTCWSRTGGSVAVGETAARRARARRARLLRAARRLRPARARLRGPRRGTGAPRCDRARRRSRPTRRPEPGERVEARLRALGRARRRLGLPDRAARHRVRAATRSTRPRSRRSRRREYAASSSSSPIASSAWTPTTRCSCAPSLWGREHGVVPRLHCENAGAIHVLRERLRAAGDLGIDAHPRSRPPLVEEEGIRRALDLARLAEAPVYIVHVSTAGGVAAIRRARAEGLDVTGETCPQYLLLDDARLRRAARRDGRDLAAAAPARARRGRLGGRARRHAERRSAPITRTAARARPSRSTSSSRAARAWRRACR